MDEPAKQKERDEMMQLWQDVRRSLVQGTKNGFRDIQSPYQEILRERWPRLYPRTYAAPGGWFSPRQLAVERLTRFLQMLILAGMPEDSRARFSKGYAISSAFDEQMLAELTAERVPTFWVKRILTEDLLHTKNIPDMEMKELRLPFNAAQFMLPDRAVMIGENQWLTSISYSFIPPDNYEDLVSAPLPEDWPDGLMIISITRNTTTPDGVSFTTFNVCNMASSFAEICAYSADGAAELAAERPDSPVSPDELRSGESKGLLLLISILMFMMTPPDDVDAPPEEHPHHGETGGGPVKEKFSKAVDALWNPIWIGEEYEKKRKEHQGGTHASPRFHVRREHWKRVHYGVGRIHTRFVRIAQTSVNA